MNRFSINILKLFRKTVSKLYLKQEKKSICEQDPNKASEKIYNALISDSPSMIARFGSTELTCLVNYLGVKNGKGKYLDFVKGKTLPWWWESAVMTQMQQWSGFFPPTREKIEQFCQLMIKEIDEVNILGSWLENEKYFEQNLDKCTKLRLYTLEPFWSNFPWTKALEGKRVLVVHPFSETIKQQYKKREVLFSNNLLPVFELKTIKAVQSIGGEITKYKDWFEALNYMKSEIDKTDYDICLIGAGAYGFPLAAHVKRNGKKGFHMGGSLQLLFGIKGKRWEDPNYGINAGISYPSLFNKHWVRPLELEKPKNSKQVEDNCYW